MSTPERAQRIDDAVEAWHVSGPDETRELHEYLGWTWDEYRAYVERNVYPPERSEPASRSSERRRKGA
jgi:hypothetical protein